MLKRAFLASVVAVALTGLLGCQPEEKPEETGTETTETAPGAMTEGATPDATTEGATPDAMGEGEGEHSPDATTEEATH